MRSLIFILIATQIAASACHPRPTSENESITLSAGGQAAPLNITGYWQATEVWSSLEDQQGVRRQLHVSSQNLPPALWRVKVDINSSGAGVIGGNSQCLVRQGARSTPNKIRPYASLNLMFGLMAFSDLIRRTAEEVECARSEQGLFKDFVIVGPSRSFFGKELDSVARNLGVFGEEKSISAVDKECKSLRGVRFVNIANASACVGYADASANRIRFLIIPAGEIYALRVNMIRD